MRKTADVENPSEIHVGQPPTPPGWPTPPPPPEQTSTSEVGQHAEYTFLTLLYSKYILRVSEAFAPKERTHPQRFEVAYIFFFTEDVLFLLTPRSPLFPVLCPSLVLISKSPRPSNIVVLSENMSPVYVRCFCCSLFSTKGDNGTPYKRWCLKVHLSLRCGFHDTASTSVYLRHLQTFRCRWGIFCCGARYQILCLRRLRVFSLCETVSRLCRPAQLNTFLAESCGDACRYRFCAASVPSATVLAAALCLIRAAGVS